MIRILLAEDQGMVRQGLKMMIETDAELRVTGEASNGQEAIALCESHHFDVVVLDIRMPVMDGLEAARIINSRWPERKVLILTTFNDDQYALEALKSGASGYMLKDAEPEELIRAIRSCLSGGLSLQDHVAAKVVPRLIKQTVPEIDPAITPRELDIIRRIGEGRSNKEVSAELGLSVGTVKNHISIILDKLELRDRTQLAIYAIRHNIV
ncbi:DNA-binding response regulator, NarL/FixJ family, contains REC and HTH domains [Evansella caseinilytica]|uniref:DNA-binding response regulator, NarL/FixJ family, contains REC and HTH domains n=1 Tax=Evansella caseinilytica TaxID=1503961 RepID=A0A1H3SUW9_9BACI|nr:response regulator transcription factor [Evansella caseinilytica]SDZ40929.1 DNA-binding response regulator, NarL/FixJ family, contains REC and HTH domains [Evansella caseinilytica]